MSRMSEVHQDLESIHQILLGQRKVAQDAIKALGWNLASDKATSLSAAIETIDNLLLEFEAAGVVWPDNVVSLDTVTSLCVCKTPLDCGRDCQVRPTTHPEDGV